MIVDLFSHKIHSSGDNWPEKLAELAAIFGEFDGLPYDREAFEQRLGRISPRSSYVANEGRSDHSKFRDEISAYPAYLGLYHLRASEVGWVVHVSETAKRYLLREEPDVGSFLRLQLPLFQYPNAMGAVHRPGSQAIHFQKNASARTLNFIRQGIHLSPMRLIAIALKADAELNSANLLEASISFDEIMSLANLAAVNKKARPNVSVIKKELQRVRSGLVIPPPRYERRFHLLRHTEIFEVGKGEIAFRAAVNEADRSLLMARIEAICSIGNEFTAFDKCLSAADLVKIIQGGDWATYFDGVKTLPPSVVEVLARDPLLEVLGQSTRIEKTKTVTASEKPIATDLYQFRARSDSPSAAPKYDRRRDLADPEITKIKRQRRNLAHKELIDKMDSLLRRLGAEPKENDHVDLYAKIPNDGSFIFEMKSGGDSLLEQIRKGLSQLYEYRFRYKSMIHDENVSLCLVLPSSPNNIPWMTEYLCIDREINICWFDKNGEIGWPPECAKQMSVLMPSD